MGDKDKIRQLLGDAAMLEWLISRAAIGYGVFYDALPDWAQALAEAIWAIVKLLIKGALDSV